MQNSSTSANPYSFLSLVDVIVFDCDGVLFDSKEANIQFYNHILKQIGHPNPVQQEQHEFVHMHPVRESLGFLLGSGEAFRSAAEYVQTMDIWPFNKHLQREPGLLEILKLSRSCYRTALATNRTVSTHEVLAHFDLDQYFEVVVSASDVRHPKPHPEIMERILKVFQADPDQILYVGDSSVDEAFAKATGVFFAAYKNPKLQAHLHIAHFNELHEILSRETGNGTGKDAEPCGSR